MYACTDTPVNIHVQKIKKYKYLYKGIYSRLRQQIGSTLI